MKLHHLADALTLTEFLLTIALVILTVLDFSADVIIWIFVTAELCDAFDGICARKWKYPSDGKKRWWRQWAPEIDQITDILLALAAAAFITFKVTPLFGYIVVVPMGIFCLLIQLFFTGKYENERVILFRRIVYVLAIGVAVILLIFATSWPLVVKEITICIGFIIGVGLIIVKRNRLTQVKTELGEHEKDS